MVMWEYCNEIFPLNSLLTLRCGVDCQKRRKFGLCIIWTNLKGSLCYLDLDPLK